jgi:hypothetical protein
MNLVSKSNFILIVFTAMLYSCSETTFEIPQPCVEDHNFAFEYADLKLISDTVSISRVYLSRNGYIDGQNIAVKYNGFTGTAIIYGTVCSEGKMTLDVKFESPNENHTMKITAEMPYTTITGEIYYCVKTGGDCNYLLIGHITGYLTNQFIGYYYIDEPIYQGSFYITFNP